MKIDRIMGVVLSILIFSFFTIKYIDSNQNEVSPFELIGDNGYISADTITYNEKVLGNSDSTSEVIKFTNTNNYPVEFNKNDITITCTGTGSTKEEDEFLASNNYSVNVKFSETENGTLYNSLLVPKGKSIYIHIISEYNGTMPSNPVSCNYSLNL